jgi:anaerobic magnesium-protoporphyrin IX monomethyl ester cyclase
MNSKPNIILVATRTGYWEENESNSYMCPPVSLLAISSFLVNKYEVKIIDQRFKGWKEQLKLSLKNHPVFVGISMMAGIQIEHSLEACRYIKTISDVKIVAGGVHPTLLPAETVANNLIDFVVLGEGEQTIVELADALLDGQDVGNVQGIAFMNNGQYHQTPDRELLDLDSLPPLPYYLLDRSINDFTAIIKDGLILETSRGCPFQCTYCYNALFNKHSWRQKSATKVIADLRYYYDKYKINRFHIIDDNFFVDLDRAREILQNAIAIDANMEIIFQGVRADSICKMDKDFFALLKQYKQIGLRVGIESGSQRILDLINKNTTLEQYRQANQLLADHKIKSYYNFMIGFPFETIADFKKTTRFAVELMEANPYARGDFMAIYQPYPGTALFDDCVERGYFKKPARLEDFTNLNSDEVNLLCFSAETKKLLENILIASYSLLIRKQSQLLQFPGYLRPVARFISFIQKLRLKYFCFGGFWIERFFYYYNKQKFYKKDYKDYLIK